MKNTYHAIRAVQASLAEKGIGKEQENSFDRYKFRGIDDVYNALAPMLSEHGLSIIPVVTGFEQTQVRTSNDKPAFHTLVTVDYVLSSGDDEVRSTIVGEAQDRGDKGMNKAMSAAYKLLCFQMFCIPTEGGSDDSESDSPELGDEKLGEYEIVTLAELAAKQSMTDDEIRQFCQLHGANTLEDIPLSHFAKCHSQLTRRLERMSREYAEGETAQ